MSNWYLPLRRRSTLTGVTGIKRTIYNLKGTNENITNALCQWGSFSRIASIEKIHLKGNQEIKEQDTRVQLHTWSEPHESLVRFKLAKKQGLPAEGKRQIPQLSLLARRVATLAHRFSILLQRSTDTLKLFAKSYIVICKAHNRFLVGAQL